MGVHTCAVPMSRAAGSLLEGIGWFGWRGDSVQSAFVRCQYLVDPQAHARAVRKSRRGPDRRRRLCFVVSRHLERDDAGKGKSLDALAAWNCPVRDPDRARRTPGGLGSASSRERVWRRGLNQVVRGPFKTKKSNK